MELEVGSAFAVTSDLEGKVVESLPVVVTEVDVFMGLEVGSAAETRLWCIW